MNINENQVPAPEEINWHYTKLRDEVAKQMLIYSPYSDEYAINSNVQNAIRAANLFVKELQKHPIK